MSDIEKDIKNTKELIIGAKLYKQYEGNKYYKSIENILKDYTRQKQINKEHQKENGELREKVKELEEENQMFKDNKVLVSRYFRLKDNSIQKQKIKNKIEELNKKEQELQNTITEEEREEYSDANISFLLCDIEIKREILKELLEDK